MIALDIYISENCWSCEEAVRIADEVAPLFPNVSISLLDLQTNPAPEEVFAVPTYVLNGKVAYLGNPTREQLIEKLASLETSVSVTSPLKGLVTNSSKPQTNYYSKRLKNPSQ